MIFPWPNDPPLDLFEGEVLWKGDKVRVEEGVTIEGAKEQEDRTWSQIIELDRGGSTSKDEESQGQGSDKVWGDTEKDPKIGVGLGKYTGCETS